ncbi:hypothetical protein CHISP_1311 [Chitinispirillum alkaliphilum]|nr:hypothetical protein CHISP_1311 [Chitinispirillum alkaliphilum]
MLKVLEVIIVVLVVKGALSLFRNSKKKKSFLKNTTTKITRFDCPESDITDGEFEDV